MKIDFERYGRNKFSQELQDACHEYLLHGLRNGCRKVELHFKIANVIYEAKTGKIQKYIVCSASDYRDFDNLHKIHDEISCITGHLDKVCRIDVHDLAGTDFDKAAKKMSRAIRKKVGI